MTQWFERNRFEYHPEYAGTPYAVLLGLLGRDVTQGRTGDAPVRPGGRATGRHLPLLRARRSTASVAPSWPTGNSTAAWPSTATRSARSSRRCSPTDGKTYTVQYFERNRFEYHPENAGTPYAVLLGLLGVPGRRLPGARRCRKPNVATPLVVADQFKGNAKWQTPRTMTGPAGMQISLFAVPAGPRMLAVAPNGDLFASLTRANQVVVLPDRNGDGIADDVKVFAEGLASPTAWPSTQSTSTWRPRPPCCGTPIRPVNSPHPAHRSRWRSYRSGTGQGLVKDVNHDTRSITFGPDSKMYISAGSDCDVCEEGDPRRAAIMRFNDDGSDGVVYRAGAAQRRRPRRGPAQRPAVGLGERAQRAAATTSRPTCSRRSWRAAITAGPTARASPAARPAFGKSAAYCAGLQSAPAALPAHIAPLGIRFSPDSTGLPAGYRNGIFIALHGSSAHTPPYGADVRFVSLRPGQMAARRAAGDPGQFARRGPGAVGDDSRTRPSIGTRRCRS